MNELVSVRIEERGTVVIAQLTGELDLASAGKTGELIAQAVGARARGLVVDLSELEFIDSSGVAMLFSLVRQLARQRQQLRLVAPPAPVARVLEIVEFERSAPIDRDVEQAIAAIERGEE